MNMRFGYAAFAAAALAVGAGVLSACGSGATVSPSQPAPFSRVAAPSDAGVAPAPSNAVDARVGWVHHSMTLRFCNADNWGNRTVRLELGHTYEAGMDGQWRYFALQPNQCVDATGWMTWKGNFTDADDGIDYVVRYDSDGNYPATMSTLKIQGRVSLGMIVDYLGQALRVEGGGLVVATGATGARCTYGANGYPTPDTERSGLTEYKPHQSDVTYCDNNGWFYSNWTGGYGGGFGGTALIMLSPVYGV